MKINIRNSRAVWFWVTFFLINSLSGGCNYSNLETLPELNLSHQSFQDTYDEYILQAGDVLHIKFYYNPELNEVIPVRPDGKISLQLIDEVQVEGLSSRELTATLKEKYASVFNKPELTVMVKEFAGRKVYVGGEIISPRVVNLRRNMTALQAILDSGGIKETACMGNVVLVRKKTDNSPMVARIDLQKVITGAAPENDIILQPFDVIFVPKTQIANVNKFIDQYINKIIPDFINAGFNYTILEEDDK